MTNLKPRWFAAVLWKMARQQPFRYIWALFIWTSIWTMPIAVGVIAARYFDALAVGIDTTTLVLTVTALGAYAFGRAVFIFLGMRNHASLLFRAAALMRKNLLVRIYELPGAAALDETPGEIVSRFRDDVEHVIEPFDITVDFVGALISGTVSFVILWTIDPTITMAVAVPIAVVAFVANRTGGLIRRYRTEARDATEAITGFLGETFNATQSVKVAGAESYMLEHFRELNEVRRSKMVRDRTLSAVLLNVFRSAVNVGTGLVLLLAAGRLGISGSTGISLGEFALFVYLLNLTTDAGYFYGIFVARSKQGSVSIDRLTNTLSGKAWKRLFIPTPIHLDDGGAPIARVEPASQPFRSLRVEGLTYHYNGSSNGIDDIDLEVNEGEFVVVTGKIGSGKTTLLRTVLGLLPAEAGSLEWNDRDIEDASTWMVPPRAAYTPQVPRLFSMSLEDNLVLGAAMHDGLSDNGILDESIHIATMGHDIDMMAEGLGTMIGPRGVRLSGGQIQRTATARMLTRVPQLLVLDDVSSALDVETERLMWSRLFEERGRVATLVVSHRHAALARADRVVVMDKGRVVAVGTAAELEESSETFRAIWEGALGATNGVSSRG